MSGEDVDLRDLGRRWGRVELERVLFKTSGDAEEWLSCNGDQEEIEAFRRAEYEVGEGNSEFWRGYLSAFDRA